MLIKTIFVRYKLSVDKQKSHISRTLSMNELHCSVPMSQYPDKCVIPSNLHSLTSSFTPVLVNFYGLCVIPDERAAALLLFIAEQIDSCGSLSLSIFSLLLRGASTELNIDLISLGVPLTKEYLMIKIELFFAFGQAFCIQK